MKGIIRANQGLSRYTVGVASADQPLADELKKYQDLYDATIPRITDAYGALNDLRDGYNAALDAIAAVAADYELCRLDFSSTNCLATGRSACESAYLEADAACLEIESGIGECDPDCQRERARCQESAKSVRLACLAQVEIDCAEAEFKHIEECQKTWAPQIAKAQEAALKLLPGMQEALYNLQHEQALQWQLARKLNELEGIASREHQIVCYRAQYDDALEIDSEVEMARTPNWRNVITGIVTEPTPCLHDARVLPSGHLFVNAALWPGFETWRPTWRVGRVQEIIGDKLKIEFAPANMPGGLGTLYTVNPIDCTPPQCYFDGKSPLEAEADIKAARAALKAAQQDLLDLVKVRTECIAEFDQAWFDQCYGTAVELCDAAFGEAMEQPTLDKGQCYDDAQTTCQEQTEAGLAACTESFQPAIDEAQAEVDAAQAILDGYLADLESAQMALQEILDRIQACKDEINTPEWQAAKLEQLLEGCTHAAGAIYDECRDDGGTVAYCSGIRDAHYEACALDREENLQIYIDAALAECTTETDAQDIPFFENAIDTARVNILNAEIALRLVTEDLEAKQKLLADCQDGFVLADCLDAALQLCDDTFQMAEDTYTQQKAACYQEAMAECDRQRDAAIQACYDDNADAIEAAQIVVDEATRDVELATNGRYNPANPLILECPVAHCQPERYQVGDEVLIDFPVRSGSTAMAVWDSRRVIGWATETRICITWTIWYYDVEEQKPGNLPHGLVFVGTVWQEDIPDGGNGTEITVQDGVDAYYTSAFFAFTRWTDGGTNPTRRELMVTENLNIGAESAWFPFDGNSLITASVGSDNAVGFASALPEILRNHAGGLPDYEVVYTDDFGWNSEYDEPSTLLYKTPPADDPPADVWALLPQSLTRVIGFRHIPSGRTRTYTYTGWLVSDIYHIGQFPGTMTA